MGAVFGGIDILPVSAPSQNIRRKIIEPISPVPKFIIE